MQTLIGIALLLGLGFAQGGSPAFGSVIGDVFTKGTNEEPAVLPWACIVLQRPITKGTESETQGAFAVDGLPPRSREIEVNAPGLYEALAVKVSAGTSSTIPDQMNVRAVTSTTSTQLTRLTIECAFSRKVHHA